MRTCPRAPDPPPNSPGAGDFVRSAMNDTVMRAGESFLKTIRCPQPPRNFPAPPESLNIVFSMRVKGVMRSITSIGVWDTLLG